MMFLRKGQQSNSICDARGVESLQGLSEPLLIHFHVNNPSQERTLLSLLSF